ncbi:DeoR/GlpR family DNA-binding transcription regulator [Paracoccus versutus]|uniref:DeoR/GlpR family DNA-binding transcription regulator n=1 Tax=Paracoccus versutus TaxID=34007 RepID=UPI00215D85B3|nr:DeoR/GlpR family DNA-binding transcription regulator [Paracoccus versutus]
MHPTERRARIVELVQRNHSHSVDELAEALDSSRETIRRDLVALDRDGLLRRYHGGARSLTDAANFQVAEESFSVRLTRHGEAKKKLARLAATLFEPGSSLFVDTGTTTLAFAQELALFANAP